MYAVIFEVEPASGRRGDYLDLAAQLRPELEKIDGFISVERFQSLTQEGKILSLSFWRDEEAVARWRSHAQHREAQRAGRTGIFRTYRLRVAAVLRAYGLDDRAEAPQPPPDVYLAPGDFRCRAELCRAEKHLAVLDCEGSGNCRAAVRSGFRRQRQSDPREARIARLHPARRDKRPHQFVIALD